MSEKKLRVLHVIGEPVGDLFRHVTELARAQIARGHEVGLVVSERCDDEGVAVALAELEPRLPLGLARLLEAGGARPSDVGAILRLVGHTRRLHADIVHGHGARGGFYARAACLVQPRGPVACCYTPDRDRFQGGDKSLVQAVHTGIERWLARGTDLLLFESVFVATRFHARIGETGAMVRIVQNGLDPEKFVPITPDADAADFVSIGDLREGSGIDVLIDASAIVRRRIGHSPTLVVVGDGPDRSRLETQARARGISDAVRFLQPLPAGRALGLGRTLVVTGRAPPLSYTVLEAAAAQVPMIAGDSGAVGEAFGPYRDRLSAVGDPMRLARAMEDALDGAGTMISIPARDLAAYVRARFSVDLMTSSILAGYHEAIARRAPSPHPQIDFVPFIPVSPRV